MARQGGSFIIAFQLSSIFPVPLGTDVLCLHCYLFHRIVYIWEELPTHILTLPQEASLHSQKASQI